MLHILEHALPTQLAWYKAIVDDVLERAIGARNSIVAWMVLHAYLVAQPSLHGTTPGKAHIAVSGHSRSKEVCVL